eukprot:TRINITY_DN64197_c0_g1_i1.p1 TRINITY_DN64197_c0_g1~~TRINITY_DN64197_c0_g1_i1.p1  ORF type:complete len:703 (-),score=144.38 TRINITY_DN64197_c0_g1_i1:61-2169(-)
MLSASDAGVVRADVDGEQVAAAMDGHLRGLERSLLHLDASRGKAVKLQRAELDILDGLGAARDLMMVVLQNGGSSRAALKSSFGGDCVRISRVRAVLDSMKLSDSSAADFRVLSCRRACEAVEQVLADLGFAWTLQQARLREAAALAAAVAGGRRGGAAEGEAEAAKPYGDDRGGFESDSSAERSTAACSSGTGLEQLPGSPCLLVEEGCDEENTISSSADYGAFGLAATATDQDADAKGAVAEASISVSMEKLSVGETEVEAVITSLVELARAACEAEPTAARELSKVEVSAVIPGLPEAEASRDQAATRSSKVAALQMRAAATVPVEAGNGSVAASFVPSPRVISEGGARLRRSDCRSDDVDHRVGSATVSQALAAALRAAAPRATTLAIVEATSPVADNAVRVAPSLPAAAPVPPRLGFSGFTDPQRSAIAKLFAYYAGPAALAAGTGLCLARFRRLLRDAGLLAVATPAASSADGACWRVASAQFPGQEPPLSQAQADLALVQAAGACAGGHQQAQRLPTPKSLGGALVSVAGNSYDGSMDEAVMAMFDFHLYPLAARLPASTAVEEAAACLAEPEVAALMRDSCRSVLAPLFSRYASGLNRPEPYRQGHWTSRAVTRWSADAELAGGLSHQDLHQLFCDCTTFLEASGRGETGKLSFAGFRLLLMAIAQRVHRETHGTPRLRLSRLFRGIGAARTRA